MTFDARTRLVARGDKIVAAADRKLSLPENEAKGDGWDEYTDEELLDLLDQEVEEVRELLGTGWRNPRVMDEREHRELLLDESGDLLNTLRFICSKYGAI